MTTTAPTDALEPTVRQAARTDLLAVFRIEQASFPQPWPYSAFEQFLASPGFLVAEVGGPDEPGQSGIVGYVVADTVPNHGQPLGHVKDLAVHPDRRGEGVGSLLLGRALATLDDVGVSSVKLEVRAGNERARSLYERFGFRHLRTIPNYYDDGEDAFVLVR
ncbi:GNAT family N-acetyltransferase [Halapricum hydrolyticum]|uniref:GNAT family N-acetyltransferase n=1 Tax=Halapricum hydrolyticum TaxID=2979991 RepID=A0AAE3IBK5_9EURY|nr:GNAT family N-acetyltransferase [Halapricum hydrolyticum]MCU4717682.1 GNAT family N-acetyltransferase [Halapricum hydrolyticum]MCU4726789.1 GNAT family N-acetyltransferase [Halapricum hydrolyticum]